MTTLSELINEYLFDDNEDGVELYDKWLDEYPHYDRQIDIMKDNGEDDDYEDEAMEVYREEFIFQMFNNWERGYNFWGAVKLEDRANEIDTMDFLSDLKGCIKWFKDEFDTTIDITTMTEEKIWNTIAYWFIHEGRKDDIEEKFVKDFTMRVRDKMEEELQSDREYRYSCDICYEKKQIEGICASCGTKYFCRGCWRKTAGKLENCPFCRNIMTFPVSYSVNLDRDPTKNCLCYKRNEDKVKWRQNTRLAISVIPQFVKCLEEKRRTDEIIQNCIRKANEERMAKVVGVCNFCEKNITAGELTPFTVCDDKKTLMCSRCLKTPSIEECCPDGDDFQNWILGMFLSLTRIRRRIIN